MEEVGGGSPSGEAGALVDAEAGGAVGVQEAKPEGAESLDRATFIDHHVGR